MLVNQEEETLYPYEVYCLRCSTRTSVLAPLDAEQVDLWECVKCGEMSGQWHPEEDGEEEDTGV